MGGKEASGGNLRVVPEGYRLFWGREPLVQEFNTAVSRSLAVQRFGEGETMFHTMLDGSVEGTDLDGDCPRSQSLIRNLG